MNWIQIANLSMAVVLLGLNLVILRKISKVRKNTQSALESHEKLKHRIDEMLEDANNLNSRLPNNNCRTMHG